MTTSKKLPPTIKNSPYSYLWKKHWKDMHCKNKMFSVCFVGKVGSGKSYSTISLGYLLDRDSDDTPRFSLDNLVFSAEQFADLLNTNLEPGRCVILDDAGLMLHNKDAMTKQVRELSKIFMSVRHRNLCILLSLPNFHMLEKQVRQVLGNYCEVLGIDFKRQQVVAKFHELQTSARSGTIYHHSPITYIKKVHPGLGMTYSTRVKRPFVRFNKPPATLCKAYEKKREAEMQKFYAGSKARMRGDKEKPESKSFSEWYELVKKDLSKYMIEGKVDEGRLLLAHIPARHAHLLTSTLNKEIKTKKHTP